MRAWFIAAAVALGLIAPAASAQKLPSAYDGRRDGYVYNGKQNMPFQLYGVAVQWDKDCNKGNAAKCVQLAQAFETGLGDLVADMRVAVGYWMEGCKKGSGPACARAAALLRDGSPGFTNEEVAQQMATRGCQVLKNQTACSGMAAGLASSGDAGAQQQASAMLDSTCAAGDSDGCRYKANALFYDKKDDASRAQAIPLFEAGCKAKQAWGCLGMADAYIHGWGVTKNLKTAGDYERTGCLQGQGEKVRLCTLYGNLLTYSSDKAEMNKGEKLLAAGCNARDALACRLIGDFVMGNRDGRISTFADGIYLLRRGCDLDEAKACHLLGVVYEGRYGLAADRGVQLALEEKACRLGSEEGCSAAKYLLDNNPGLRASVPAIDPSLTAAEQLRRAAEAVSQGDKARGVAAARLLASEYNEDAQWLLGGWSYYGLPGALRIDKAEGMRLFGLAADGGNVEAAIFMGMAYWYGDGVPEDHAKGENYMGIAANRGSQEAAAIYRSMKAEPIRQENARRAEEMARWEAERAEYWATHPAWTPSWTAPSSPYNPTPSGPSVSQILDNSAFNQMINYYSGGTSVCPSYNRYC